MLRTITYSVLAFVIGFAGGGYVFYGLGEHDALERDNARLESIVHSSDYAVRKANADAQKEQRRVVAASLEAARKKRDADEVIANAKPDPVRADCEWSDTERMRIEKLYAIYGYAGKDHSD